MSFLVMEVAGKNGQIALYDDKLVIKRAGVLSLATQGLKGTKEIPLSQITAIQLKQCSKWAGGYLQLSIHGSTESKGGLMSAIQDENSVLFGTSDPRAIFEATIIENINAEWIKLKEEILRRAEIARKPLGAAQTAPSSLDEIEKLASLRQRGIITEDEFQAKKKQLLGM
jgi:hypothetical protein